MSKMYARPLAMTVLAIALAAGTAGCQTMADLDPTGLLGDDSPAPESQFYTHDRGASLDQLRGLAREYGALAAYWWRGWV